MTIYAKQVPPEIQESPLDIFRYYDIDVPVIVISNRRGANWESEHRDLWDNIDNIYDEMCEEYENIGTHYGHYKNLTEICKDYFPDKKWTTKLVGEIRKVFEENDTRYYFDGSAQLSFFRIVTGLDWRKATICGCVQGDWAEIIYIHGELDVDMFEIEYFDMGSEWIVHDNNNPVDYPEDINGFSMYAYKLADEDIKDEIRAAMGADKDEEVVLYKHKGYVHESVYEIA